MKKILSLSLVLVIMASLITSLPIEVSATTEGIYTYTVLNGKATIKGCNTSASGAIKIPENIGGYPVTKIYDYAFCYCTSITSISIPDSVIWIGEGAFFGCTNLTNVNIPESITSIEWGVFSSCESLTYISIPDSITKIGEMAFIECSSLERVIIPDSVKTIEAFAFSYCNNLESIRIPNSVTLVEENVFEGCTSLTNVNIPESITTIGDGMFAQCDSLTYISIPDGITGVGYAAFYGCNGLKSVRIPNSVKNIGEYAFSYCNSLTDVYYDGYKSDWEEITISSENDFLINATIHYNYNDNIGNDSDFQIDIYRANYLLNSELGRTMEKDYLNFDTPSKTIVDTGKNNGLSTMIDIWKLVTGGVDAVDDPTKIVGFVGEQKDVYEAIIMDLLESSVDSRIMECINNDLTKETKEFTDIVISDMKNLYQYEDITAYKNICTMDDDFIKHLKKTVTDDFEYEHGNANDISKISSFIGKTIEYATDFEQYCEKLIAFINMLQLSQSMKNIMQDMYNECPLQNLVLKSALLECNNILNSGADEFVNIMVAEFFGVVGLNVGEFFFEKMWDNIKTEFMIINPSAFAISAAYNTGKYITNAAFNTDTIAEKYYKLAAVNEVEDLLKDVYYKIKIKYQKDGTVQQAKNFNTMVDFMFNMMDADCKYSVTYLNETNDNLVANIKHVFSNNGIYDAIDYVGQLEQKYDYFHERVTTEWIVDIANKNPSIFKQYLSVLEDSLEKQKAYFINCPVDVYVYDKSGVIVGSVVNNVPYCREDANITIGVVGDRKTIYMYGEEYDIVYAGNNTGTMDITVTEYDKTSSVARNVFFNNLELTDGLTYTSTEKGTNSTENIYTLANEAAESIAPDYDSLVDVEDETYTARVTRGYFTNTMVVSQELHGGENVDITAYVPEGYKFVNWTSDAECDIFDNADSITTKIAMPEYDVNITANIIEIPTLSISSIADSSVTVKSKGCDNIAEGKMILAIYDDNGALEQLKTENYAKEITFDELKLKSGTAKVMLWQGLDVLIPLTEATEKLFYFETSKTE